MIPSMMLSTISADRRLGRLIQYDQRSLAFGIRELLPEKKPRSYTWSAGVVLDQGQEGSCVGHGFAAELIARPKAVKGVTHETAVKIYKTAQDLDPWPGDNYNGTSVLAGIQAVQKLYPRAIESYRWANSLDDIILTVGYLGPVVIGVSWYSDMYEPNSFGFIKPLGPVLGGHCLLVRAVNVKDKFFTLRNSWGAGYGKNGDAYITFDDFKTLFAANGEACVPMHRGMVIV